MRLSRFLMALTFVTSLSLLYVFQQTEIIRLAYLGQKRSGRYQDLLDKNSILRYTIKSKVSLVQIGNSLTKDTEYEMPDTYRLVRLPYSREGFRLKVEAPEKETILSRIFGIKSQAEAKTLNSQ